VDDQPDGKAVEYSKGFRNGEEMMGEKKQGDWKGA
jgi:hypothetical protein